MIVEATGKVMQVLSKNVSSHRGAFCKGWTEMV